MGNLYHILKDEVLDDRILEDIKNCPDKPNAPNDLLVTGVTGFLGAHMLVQLLERREDRHIYCMVRGTDYERVKRVLQSYEIWKDRYAGKFTIIHADLSKERLGLPDTIYARLLRNVSQILHIAADTNHVKPYSQLRNTNVGGTAELIKLASKVRKKEFIYISTLSVLDALDERNEDSKLEKPELIDLGYIQTKYVSEKLLQQAKAAGMKVEIIRVGRVAPSMETGIWRDTDGYNMIFKSFYQLNMVPDIKHIPLFFTPVDYMSQCIDKIMQTNIDTDGRIYHLHNAIAPISLKDCYNALKSIKPNCRFVPHEVWYEALADSEVMELQMCLYIADMYLPMGLGDIGSVEDPTVKTRKLFEDFDIPVLTEFHEDYLIKIFSNVKRSIDEIKLGA